MSPRVCGIHEYRCKGSLVVQTQMNSGGPGVIIDHVGRSECCWSPSLNAIQPKLKGQQPALMVSPTYPAT